MRRPQSKISSVADSTSVNDNLYSAAIIPLETNGKILPPITESFFLLNPNSIQDTKQVNWVANSIPGQSDPIYQWVSGGPRIINFEALVTKDISRFPALPTGKRSPGAIVANVVGTVASKIAGITLNANELLNSLVPSDGESLSIASHLAFYRSLCYPEINSNRELQASPPLVMLAFGKTLDIDAIATEVTPQTELFVVTSVSIRITKQLPNLAPMEALVSFELQEYRVSSKSRQEVLGGVQKPSNPSVPSFGRALPRILE